MLEANETELVTTYKNPEFWSGILNQQDFDIFEKIAWMQRNWFLSVYASIIYVIVIFGLREWMKTRPPFDLKGPLVLWNLSLALFSIKGASVIISEFYTLLTTRGLNDGICANYDFSNQRNMYWSILFIYSKIFELGDTLFIVLRKRKLIFLHWYHHITVLVGVWHGSQDLASTGNWFAALNYTVHAFMYTYFTLTALGIKVPKPIAMTITAGQLGQFVIGLIVHGYALTMKLSGVPCGITDFQLFLVFSVGISYLILFGNFFKQAYLASGPRKKIE